MRGHGSGHGHMSMGGRRRDYSHTSLTAAKNERNDEKKSFMVTTVSIKDIERYIDTDGIQ